MSGKWEVDTVVYKKEGKVKAVIKANPDDSETARSVKDQLVEDGWVDDEDRIAFESGFWAKW